MLKLADYIPVDPLEGRSIRCYRYLGSHWMDSLATTELKAADVDEFNDVFDGRGKTINELTDDAVIRHANTEIIHKIPGMTPELAAACLDNLGVDFLRTQFSSCVRNAVLNRDAMHESKVICFSALEGTDYESDALMWSHYAKNWSGVRLGFEFLYDLHKPINFATATTPFVIDYVRYGDRPVIDLSKLTQIVGDAYFAACFRMFMLSKSSAWKYEKEWRMVIQNSDAIVRYVDNKINYFCKFHRQLLKSVDIGPCMKPRQQAELVLFLKSYYPHVIIRKVVLHDEDYGFDYLEVE